MNRLRAKSTSRANDMKIAEIDWQLFWYALSEQDSVGRERWLGRWVFADDAVRLSMQPTLFEAGNSNLAGKSLGHHVSSEGTRNPHEQSAARRFAGTM